MKCPNCKLENPDDAMICDCGYNFESKMVGKSLLLTDLGVKPSIVIIRMGWLFSLLGGLIGIIIACELSYSKLNGSFKYDLETRKTGKNMLMVSIIIFGIFFLSRLVISINGMNQ